MSALTSSQPNGCQAHQHLCSSPSPSPPTANGTGASGDGVHNHHGTPCRAFCYKYYDFLANQKGNIWGSDSGRYTNETTSTNDWDICWEYLRTHSCRDSHCTKRHIHFSDGHDLDHDDDAPAHVGVGPQVQAQQQAQDICDVPEYVPLPTPSLISSSCSYSSALSSPSCVPSLPPPPSSLASSLPSLCSALTSSTSISATSASSTHSHSPPPDYSDVIKYVLWAIIKHRSCSSQRLVQVLKLNRNWINAVLYNFLHCGIIEANQQLRIYQLSRAFSAQYVQQTNPLMMQLQQKFGALEWPTPSQQSQSPSDDQSTDHHHHTNSICTNHADALFAQHVRVLKHVVNEQTCAVSTLSRLTGLDAQSVLASLAYWKSLGFELPHDNPYSTSTAEGEEHHHHHHPHSAIAKTDKFICTMCRQRSTDYICIPCGHFCLCSQCKPKVYRQCPICWRQCSVIKVV